ncbi:hypothetical protein FRC12_016798 [Ceratobasidium sp. 428]|nr:hypothetical protein FRC12_016798 [Ceratobasidium sp. 428]
MPSVEDYTKHTGLQNTIIELIRLVEDASRFVLSHKYNSSVWGQSSRNRTQVDEFVMKFEILAKEFDRGMTAHVIQRVEVILSDGDLALVDKLVIPGAYYDPGQCCSQGTRAQILDEIEKWVHGGDASNSFFWIYGPAGCGKTSLASSIAKRLDHAGILAGSFFCKRDQEQLKSPENVVSSLAASLARKCQPYGAQLVMALRKNRQLMDSATRTRFEGLMVNPIIELDERIITGKLVIVIDAVDECGTAHTRKELLRCLFEMSQMSGGLKVLVTSRPNNEIRCAMDSIAARITRHDLFAGRLASVSDDITSYLRYRMSSIASPVRGNQLWPSESDVRQLAVRSNNLFIWARTVCDLIEQSFDPVSTLERVLSGEQSTDAKRALDNVYSTALSESLGNAMDGVATVRLCVGAIVLTGALNPLSDAALAALLRKRINSCSLSRVIDRLGSVLYRDDDGLVRVLHHSFSDYMTDSGCPEHYRIDLGIQNAEMTIACLELMIRSLRFNICGLEDSYIMNREVPNLQNRIPPELAYSCVYWASHLVASTRNKAATINALLDELTSGSQLLYWVEVLSLLGRTGTALTSMAQLIDWTSVRHPS